MNERPTPETDAELLDSDCAYNCGHGFYKDTRKVAWGNEGIVVLADFARDLERERDEARDQIEAMREAIKEAHQAIKAVPIEYDPRFFRAGKWSEEALAKLQPFLA